MSFANLAEMFFHSCSNGAERPAMKYKQDGSWHDMSYAHIGNRVRNLAAGLAEIGVAPGDKVILLSENRYEWAFSDYAILANGAVSVRRSSIWSPTSAEHGISRTGAPGQGLRAGPHPRLRIQRRGSGPWQCGTGT